MEPKGECAHCGRPFELESGPGRPRRYCRRSCRQRAFELRRHAGELDWADGRLVVMARELASLEDRLDDVAGLVRELQCDLGDGVVPDVVALAEDLIAAVGGSSA